MVKRSVRTYWWFGTCVRYLQDAKVDYRIGAKDDGKYVLSNLFNVFRYLSDLGLAVTREASSELREFARELSQSSPDARLTAAQATRLRDLTSDLRLTLNAELGLLEAFVVTPKRLDVQKLLNNVPTMLPSGCFERLPPIAQYDLDEAGKCTAFERPTAAAFHLMRATEAVLRAYYCSIVRRGRVDLMWGPIVRHLRSRRDASRHGPLLNHLDHIRVSFRNPTQHPDMRYTMDEVQDLWGVCIDAVGRMAKQLAVPVAADPWAEE